MESWRGGEVEKWRGAEIRRKERKVYPSRRVLSCHISFLFCNASWALGIFSILLASCFGLLDRL